MQHACAVASLLGQACPATGTSKKKARQSEDWRALGEGELDYMIQLYGLSTRSGLSSTTKQ